MTLKHISEDVDRHGNVRLYVRRRGHGKVRLHETPGTDAFLTEYRAAIASLKPAASAGAPVVRGSMKWLADKYLASADYARLDKSTRDMRRRQLERVNAENGDNIVTDVAAKHIRAIIEKMHKTPSEANNTLKTLRVVFKWAIARDYMAANPARDVERFKVVTDGFHTWTAAEIRKFLNRHPLTSKAGLALALLFLTGARRSDVVKLGRQMETTDAAGNRWLVFTETKGRTKVQKSTEVFITAELGAAIDAHKGPHMAYLVTEHKRPFKTGNAFGNWFKDRCVEAGLSHCSAHGLRKARATTAADEGASEFDIMALMGWTSPKEAERYTRKANRRRLAARAAPLVRLEDQK